MVHPTRTQFDQIIEDQIGIRLPGRPDQTPYEQSPSQNFRIGARKKEDGRVFRYGYTVVGLPVSPTSGQLLAVNSNYIPDCPGHVNEDGFMGALVDGGVARTAVIPAGQRFLDIADTAGAVLRPVNWYQGGYLIVWDDATPYFRQHYIVASEVGTATYVRLWLDHPITVDIPIHKADGVTAVDISVYRSPYSALAQAGTVEATFEPFVGMPLCGGVVPALRYIWLLTAGPVWIAPFGGAWPGAAADLRDVYANPANGELRPASVSDPTSGFQKVGYLLPTTANTSGDAWIMLQLDQ